MEPQAETPNAVCYDVPIPYEVAYCPYNGTYQDMINKAYELDDKKTMQLISKRKVEHWAKTYKERAAKLIEEGRVYESGLKTIEDSKSNGLWNFMDDVDNLVVPKDLQLELSKLESAGEFFNSINPSSKRFVLRWIKLAKTDKTRKNRIKKIAELSSKGEKLPGS